MLKDHWPTVSLGLYVGLFIVAVGVFGLWRARRRKERAPVDFRLLRAPGETLRRRMAKFDEDSILLLGGAAMAPVAVTLVPLLAFSQSKPQTWPQLIVWLAVIGLTFCVMTFFAFRWAVQKLLRYQDDRLGYLGERAVGESLAALDSGYRVFHDVPAEAGGKRFNIDHVVVGQNGVFAIETKTRRKGRARPGFEAHKVIYDGKQLIWPWAEDTHGLKQATYRAEWLAGWLNKMTALTLTVKPILALPGWYVVTKALGGVAVVNHKQVVNAITRVPTSALTADQVELIARQLDAVCRDVVD